MSDKQKKAWEELVRDVVSFGWPDYKSMALFKSGRVAILAADVEMKLLMKRAEAAEGKLCRARWSIEELHEKTGCLCDADEPCIHRALTSPCAHAEEARKLNGEPRVRIDGCKHTKPRMIEWINEGGCPVCLTASCGMKNDEVTRLRDAVQYALDQPWTLMHYDAEAEKKVELRRRAGMKEG